MPPRGTEPPVTGYSAESRRCTHDKIDNHRQADDQAKSRTQDRKALSGRHLPFACPVRDQICDATIASKQSPDHHHRDRRKQTLRHEPAAIVQLSGRLPDLWCHAGSADRRRTPKYQMNICSSKGILRNISTYRSRPSHESPRLQESRATPMMKPSMVANDTPITANDKRIVKTDHVDIAHKSRFPL